MADRLGLTQVYTGDGKGKTTAAIGLAVRAAGHGLRSRIIQFMKGETTSGEIEALRHFHTIDIDRIGTNLLDKRQPNATVRASLHAALEEAQQALDGDYEIVILDEILTAISLGVLAESEVLGFIRQKGRNAELILTGRGATSAIIEAADLVTEMREIKHPYTKGTRARAGIEF